MFWTSIGTVLALSLVISPASIILELFFICVSFIAGFNLYPLSWNCLPPFLEMHVTGCTWLDAFSIVINVIKCLGLKLGTFNIGISVCFCFVLCVCLFVFLIKKGLLSYYLRSKFVGYLIIVIFCFYRRKYWNKAEKRVRSRTTVHLLRYAVRSI